MGTQTAGTCRHIDPPCRQDLLVLDFSAVQIEQADFGHIPGDEGKIVASLIDADRVGSPSLYCNFHGVENLFDGKLTGAHAGGRRQHGR